MSALKKLRELEAQKPSAGQVARGALAGGVAGMAASSARGLVSGGIKSSITDALQAPTAAGKVGRLAGGAVKGLGSAMAGSAAFGSTMPFVRGYLDREAEKATLKQYLGSGEGGRARQQIKRTLGV
jgi:hypothetical protein